MIHLHRAGLRSRTVPFRSTLALLTTVGLTALAACSSTPEETLPTSNGVLSGPADTTCSALPSSPVVDLTLCSSADAGADSGTVDPQHEGHEEESRVLYGQEGDDDDCSMHLSWSADAVGPGRDVFFEFALTAREDGRATIGAAPYLEVFLNDEHGAPESRPVTTETSPGHYRVGPIRFDAKGTWTVRFHFYGQCGDHAGSPHGHVAFYVLVP